jgi:predicted dehydrogenase
MEKLKTLIVGFGVQGRKRSKLLKKKMFITVDKKDNADFSDIKKVPVNDYNNVFICTPDNQKEEIIKYCLKKNKNILVEKPLNLNLKKIEAIEKKAKKNKIKFYTAYNHRFEPHILEIKKILNEKKIGKVYYVKIFYGNGTAKLVNKSWRDKKYGIISDLGSHLLDLSYFLFGEKIGSFVISQKKSLENNNFDFISLINKKSQIPIQLEMTYCMWKNSFSLDILGSKGSINMRNLCKWGPSELSVGQRVFPSGIPIMNKKILKINDPTWRLEHNFFFNKKYNPKYFFKRDKWISKQVKNLG